MASRRWLFEQGTRRAKKRAFEEACGKNPTDRGRAGVKKSLLVEGDGGPLALTISGANVPDAHLLALTLDAIVVARPQPTEQEPQHLGLDKGYDNPTGEKAVADQHYIGHIRRIGEEKFDANQEKKYPARRWVVERTFSWLASCRAILVRYDRKSSNYLAILKLACALLWFRKRHRILAALF
jgi:putative transposase